MFPCDLNSFVFARKTLKNGGIKKQKESEDNGQMEEHQDDYLMASDSEHNKANKRQKFLRGGKSSSQRRLLSCVPRGGVTEERRVGRNVESRTADSSIASSNIIRGKRRLQHEYDDRQIKGGKRRCTYKRDENNYNKNTDCICFSDNGLQKDSFKDYSLPTRSKSDSNVDIDVGQSEQKLLADKTSSWNDKEQSKTQQENLCKTCQRCYNRDKDDRVTNCTAL